VPNGVGHDRQRPDLEALVGLVLGDGVRGLEEGRPLGDGRGQMGQLLAPSGRHEQRQWSGGGLAPWEPVAKGADVDPVVGVEVADEER
jgi:hypothetical protein